MRIDLTKFGGVLNYRRALDKISASWPMGANNRACFFLLFFLNKKTRDSTLA